ncbi:MAG: hypothetical protein L6Q95_00550, partial [Planctomycetes bacterium]|nr:hypothetical protein [Planctomycetota bacterium]
REGPGEPEAAAPAAEGTAAEPAPEAPPGTSAQLAEHTIRVIDEAGAPIAGAWVEVRRSERDEVTARAVTDGLGRATVPLTREDVLFVGARGFMQERVTSALRRQIAEVVLRRGYDIGGVVVDGAGNGIRGASLRLVEPFLPERTGSSGPGGRFAFDDVNDLEMTLHAEAPGHPGETLCVTPGDADIRVVLTNPTLVAGVAGVVVFPDGTGAAGAKVNAWNAGPDGRFVLDPVAPGRLELLAALERNDRRWTAKTVVEVASDGTHDPIRLVLQPLPRSWINVRVVERDGSPAGGILVGNALIGETFPKTDAGGLAVLVLDVAPGTATSVWAVQTRRDGLFPGRAEAVTGDRDGPEVVLRPRDPLPVTVVVRGPDGAALPAGVTARVDAHGNTVVRRERDAAVLAVDPLAPEFSFTASAPGFAEKYMRTAPPHDRHVEVRLSATGTISCRLVDEAGVAVREGFVHAWVSRAGSSSASGPEPDGTVRVAEVPTGRAVVTAGYDDGLPLARTEVDVRAGEVIDLGAIVLKAPRFLTGKVTGADGRAVGGAEVYAVEGESETRVFSRSDGTFRIMVPPWFDGFVLATKPGHGSVHRRASESALLDLVLRQEGKVRVEVRMPPIDRRASGWSFAARDPSTGFQWRRVEWSKIEGTTYRVSGLPPGRLVLICDIEPRDGETEVVVVAGETVPAVIEVPE